MNDMLKTVLSLSLSGSLFILVLLLCRPLYKKKLSKRWQYYIWLVVIARLLLPFTPKVSLVGSLFQGSEGPFGQIASSQYTTPSSRSDHDPGTENNANSQDWETLMESPLPTLRLIQLPWLVWLMTALILLIRKITIYQGFLRYIKAGCEEVSDTALLDRLAQIGEQAGVTRPVELYTNGLVSSPLLLGFFRPCIVLPTVNLPDLDFQYTVLHELTHFKRRDMFYKWLIQLTICLHWFNPLVYVMGRETGRACELACDEAVIRKLDVTGQRSYGDTLINAIGAGGSYKNSLASVTLNESKELLKERLEAIMSFNNKSGLRSAAALVTTALFLAAAIAAGAYARTDDDARPSPAEHYDIAASEIAQEAADIHFNIQSAAVDVFPSSDHKISVKYNQEICMVEITKNETNEWTVNITGTTENNIGNNPVQLYIPNITYGSVSWDIESSSIEYESIPSGNITASIDTSSVHFVLPAGFNGSFKADVTDGYFELSSGDGYSNSNVTASINVIVPDYFTRSGFISTYSNGSEKNVIELTATGGYVEIN